VETNNFCRNCGGQLEENAKFCATCGAEIDRVKNTDSNIQAPEVSLTKPRVDSSVLQQSSWENKSREKILQEKIKREFYTYQGRLNRWAYFQRGLILSVVCFVFLLIFGGIAAVASGVISFLFGAIAVVGYIFICIGTVMLAIRRCHDLDKSGWLSLVLFIPYVNIIGGLYILFAKGTQGDNKYGPDLLEGKD
jgi:Predicted membrane protein